MVFYIPRTQGLNTGFFDLEAKSRYYEGPKGLSMGVILWAVNVNIITAEPKNQFEASRGIVLRKLQ